VKVNYSYLDVALLKKRRVVMVLSHDLIHPSVDPRVYKEAKSLIKHGYSVSVVCRTDDKDAPNTELYEGIKIVRVYCPHPKQNINRIFRLLHNFRNVRNITKSIVALQPEVIHCHDLNALLEGALAAKKTKVPLIYDSHEDWPLLEYTRNNNSKLVLMFTIIYEYILLLRVSYKMIVSPGQTRLFTPNNSILIMNCPTKNFMQDANPEHIQEKYNLQNKIVIIYHGVVGERKGINEIISAADKLTKKFDNIRFLIVGNGYEPFQKIVKEKSLTKSFVFTGRVDYSDIPSFLSASNIDFSVLHPTRQYILSVPTKIFEGMQAGIPIIANKEFPALTNIIQKTESGLLVNCNQSEIDTALEKLISDKKLRERLGGNGKVIVGKEYTWEKQEKKLVEFYNKIFTKIT
jgi:glycosyltransferase involved in cell wall biosynthesis